jgi:branched-chain amino acid transport system ATP-binding protein
MNRTGEAPSAQADAPVSGTPALEVRDLHVFRGQAHVLQGVSLSVPRQGVTALLGRNGVGKTTTLLGILGLLPGSGTVRIAGGEVLGRPTHEIVRMGVGYVPENREVFGRVTVAENMKLAQRSDPNPELTEFAYSLFPELRDRAGQRAGTLSGGQQQMLAIARAMLHPNRLMLVDEASEGLAPAVVKQVARALAEIAQRTPILLVEQNLSVARQLADQVVVLTHGTVAYSGAAEDFFADEQGVTHLLGITAGGRSHT